MLPRLLKLTSTQSFEEQDGSVRVRGAEPDGADLILYLEIIEGGKSTPVEVRAEAVRAHRVITPDAGDVTLTSDHPVLWPYAHASSELYFRGKPVDVMSVVGALVVAHAQLVGPWLLTRGWFAANYRLQNPAALAEVLEGGHGLLSSGPVILLDAYARVLDNYGLEHSMLEPKAPSWWDGETWRPETETLHALIIGESYVIAPRFTEDYKPGGLQKLWDGLRTILPSSKRERR